MPRNPFRRRRRPPETTGDSVDFLTGDPEEDRRSIGLLLDAMVEVGSGLGLEDLLERLVDKAVEVARSERGLLLLAERGGLEVRVARESRGRSLPKTVPYSTSVAGRVFAEGTALATVVQSEREARELGRSVYDLKLRAVMCAPLEAGGHRLGVIYVDSKAETRASSAPRSRRPSSRKNSNSRAGSRNTCCPHPRACRRTSTARIGFGRPAPPRGIRSTSRPGPMDRSGSSSETCRDMASGPH